MAVLYVDEYGAAVRLSAGRIEIDKGGVLLASVRLHELECLVVQENCAVTSAALRALLREGVETAFVTHNGEYLGRLEPVAGKNVGTRKAQYRMSEREDFCLALAKRFVAGKLANMRTLIMRYARRNSEDESECAETLRRAAVAAGAADSIEELLGHEGTGSCAYFSALARIAPVSFGFAGRNRRPPLDPFNAMLGFGYALLENVVQRAVGIAGLDPFCGFFHRDAYGRESLVLDLMEEMRPVVADSVVLDCCSRSVLDPKADFEARDGGVYLSESGRKKFFKAFHLRVREKVKPDADSAPVDYSELCVRQARQLAKCIVRGVADYKPFLIK